jgi:hypothetical protein
MIDPATSVWYLRNSNTGGAPDFAPFAFGVGTWQPLSGHWTAAAAQPSQPAVSGFDRSDLVSATLFLPAHGPGLGSDPAMASFAPFLTEGLFS